MYIERGADMAFKKLIVCIMSALLALTFTGCDGFMRSADELLLSPKLEGDMYPVQQALEEAAGDKITLKYPTQGEYRSAFVMKDINGDKNDEAVAFYSTTEDSAVTMHINIIEKTDDKWESKGDLSLVGNGVESVSFADLDGNGKLEIIVGWYIFGMTEKQVGIYTFDGKLSNRAVEPYTNFSYADLTGDKRDDLIILYLNSSEKLASAKLISLLDSGVTESETVALDGGVTSYSAPVLSKLSSGEPALYVDAVKGNGMLTEIIWFENGTLHSVHDDGENSSTYRDGNTACRDFDGNGVIDIPVTELLKSTEKMAENDKVYYTNWSEFDGKKLKINLSTFMNYNDGYSLIVPKNLRQKMLVLRRVESRTRIFYSYDPQKELVGGELFRLATISVAEYNAELYEKNGYIVLNKTDSVVYAAKIIPDNEFGLTNEDITEMFAVIK